MTGLAMPPLIYVTLAEYPTLPGSPLGNAGDFTTTIDDAADEAAECEDEGRRWRCYALHLRPDGDVRHAEECTDTVAAVLADRSRRAA